MLIECLGVNVVLTCTFWVYQSWDGVHCAYLCLLLLQHGVWVWGFVSFSFFVLHRGGSFPFDNIFNGVLFLREIINWRISWSVGRFGINWFWVGVCDNEKSENSDWFFLLSLRPSFFPYILLPFLHFPHYHLGSLGPDINISCSTYLYIVFLLVLFLRNLPPPTSLLLPKTCIDIEHPLLLG